MTRTAMTKFRLRWTRTIRSDSAISWSSVRLRGESVIAKAAVDPAVGGIVQLSGLAVVDDLAKAHGDDPSGIALGELEVVDGAEHRDPVLAVHVAQVVEHHDRRFGVEACDRFVGEEDLGVLGQRSGERDPLLLAAGEGVGSDVGLFSNLQPLEPPP